MIEKANPQTAAAGSVARNGAAVEAVHATGRYDFVNVGPIESERPRYVRLRDEIAALEASNWAKRVVASVSGRLAALRREFESIPLETKWSASIQNAVTDEGARALLTHAFKGSAYTAAMRMGLIESTGYGFAGANGSGVAVTNIAASITAAGGASPANGWNEAQSSVCASRGTPSFGTAASRSLALSAALAFTIIGSATIRGVFLMIRSAAGVDPTSTVGNTSGAIYSAGLFSAPGDRVVANGDTLNVNYTASV